jgi:hypothetical protein
MRGQADVARAEGDVDTGLVQALAGGLVVVGVSGADDDDRRPLTGDGGADEAVVAAAASAVIARRCRRGTACACGSA